MRVTSRREWPWLILALVAAAIVGSSGFLRRAGPVADLRETPQAAGKASPGGPLAPKLKIPRCPELGYNENRTCTGSEDCSEWERLCSCKKADCGRGRRDGLSIRGICLWEDVDSEMKARLLLSQAFPDLSVEAVEWMVQGGGLDEDHIGAFPWTMSRSDHDGIRSVGSDVLCQDGQVLLRRGATVEEVRRALGPACDKWPGSSISGEGPQEYLEYCISGKHGWVTVDLDAHQRARYFTLCKFMVNITHRADCRAYLRHCRPGHTTRSQ